MSETAQKFKQLQEGAVQMRQSTAADRNGLLKKLWESLVDHQDAIYDAAKKERNSHKLDAAAELMMIKSEIDFISEESQKMDEAQKSAKLNGDNGETMRNSV